MGNEQNLARVADLFKALGNESRLGILVALDGEAMSVGMLAEQTQMSQPLVSQHLRTLKTVGIVSANRHGKEMIYQLADEHVAHVINDAIIHAHETPDSSI
ncbi:winged helix-turn-helix transcriptional regulator [Arcanobacterium phocisimile]|uniref:Winged helix-turn-helix transcriptional regulator n=1 Tax=Arcanobacterium phocisimile TaxID=1302235 RepID=A0ABX7IHM1_9ACTO|nr:metalloregulator ArsR/SmtB family transcription factor [Arcanobacterium phocisimile]QRV02629.1 winged helix-turn-helix transcriptional regulator [Arcanobacterium phocisimile]